MPSDPVRHFPAFIGGLAVDPASYEALRAAAGRVARVVAHKAAHPDRPAVVMIGGGTGTGKSALVNALTGRAVSATGPFRPMTKGPVAICPQKAEHHARALAGGDVSVVDAKALDGPATGTASGLVVVRVKRPSFSVIYVDSPDFDSLEAEHEKAARELFEWADVLVFVTTPEKYADEAGARFLKAAVARGKATVVVVNKLHEDSHATDVADQLAAWGLAEAALVVTVPWAAEARAGDPTALSGRIGDLSDRLKEMTAQSDLLTRELAGAEKALAGLHQDLAGLVDAEEKAWAACSTILDQALARARADVDQKLAAADDAGQRRRLKQEIGRLYRRYDVLAPVRSAMTRTLTAPARFFGLLPDREAREEKQADLSGKLDSGPLVYALVRYQARVAEAFSDGTAGRALTESRPELSEKAARDLLATELAGVQAWLSARFEDLRQGLPAHKRAGLYGLTLGWGVLILSVETIVGGGLSFFEMALDSVLAPFVTRGTLEIFVVTELKDIGRELARRTKQAHDNVLEVQDAAYRQVLERLRPADGSVSNSGPDSDSDSDSDSYRGTS